MLCRVHCNKLFYPYARLCLEPFPKFCSSSSSTIITCSLSKCSRAAEHMCVCTCPECVCACSRRQCRVHDAVPRRLLARVRRHGSRPLQRERHRQRQHHVQQRACHHRPRSARLLSAPSFQHRTDFSHFPGLHLRCCCCCCFHSDTSLSLLHAHTQQTAPYTNAELRSCVPTTVAYVIEYRVAEQSFTLARNASLSVSHSDTAYTSTDPGVTLTLYANSPDSPQYALTATWYNSCLSFFISAHLLISSSPTQPTPQLTRHRVVCCRPCSASHDAHRRWPRSGASRQTSHNDA